MAEFTTRQCGVYTKFISYFKQLEKPATAGDGDGAQALPCLISEMPLREYAAL